MNSQPINTRPIASSHSDSFSQEKNSSQNGVQEKMWKGIQSMLMECRDYFMTPQTWHLKAITKLESYETRLNTWFSKAFPRIDTFQAKLDHYGTAIEHRLFKLSFIGDWIQKDYPHEDLKTQMILYFSKLPLRVIYNIVNIFYKTIRGFIYAFAHPLKYLLQTGKQIVSFGFDLTQPETWTKIGIGIIGAELAQMLILIHPIFQISLGLGFALLFIGLCIGALKAALCNEGKEYEAAEKNFVHQCKDLPEQLLTSFFLVYSLGSIVNNLASNNIAESAANVTDKCIQKHNVSVYRGIKAYQIQKTSLQA